MRLLLQFLSISFVTVLAWKECEFTKCKWFFEYGCQPPDDLDINGGHLELCSGALFIRHLCCKFHKNQRYLGRHVEHNPKQFEFIPSLARLQ